MQKTCTQCSASFQITDEDLAFLEEVSPSFGGKKFSIPPPTLCPDCRHQRRLSWRNERVLYPRVCPKSQKKFLSPLSNEKKFPVYENDYWYGSNWDAKDYGKDFDFNRPFFEQFEELMNTVPQLGRSAVNLQNCDYVNQAGWSKDCYLIFEADYCEKCLYCNNLYHCQSSMDLLKCMNCELCYECIDCNKCYNLRFSQNCINCIDSAFLKNCIGCKHCIGCVNLRNKEYHIFNKQVTKEEYVKALKELKLNERGGIEAFRKKFDKFALDFPNKRMTGEQNEDSTGNYLWNTQRCTECYDVAQSQDCKYLSICRNMKKVYDVTNFGADIGAEYCYENHEIGDGVKSTLFSDQIWSNCYDLIYSKLCVNNTHHCFGCVGLKQGSYCILNKQYKKEEYEKLVPKIIEHMQQTGEWGEFLPTEICPYSYNETLALQWYPLTKKEAVTKGFKWKDDIEQPITMTKTIKGNQLPQSIAQVPDDILNWAVVCEETGRPFKVVKMELDFYRNWDIPVPMLHPDERHKQRMSRRNPRKLYERPCDRCKKQIQTTYAPDRPEKVFCEECYLAAVY